MTTRFERYDHGRTPGPLSGLGQSDRLGMEAPHSGVGTLPDDLAVWSHDNSPDPWVRMCAVTGRQFQGTMHQPLPGRVLVHQAVRRSIRYEEPCCFLANSFISTASAEASHCEVMGRLVLATTPIEMDTTGNA